MAVPAQAPATLVLADSRTAKVFAIISLSLMLADARTMAFLACAPDVQIWADACTAAMSALVSYAWACVSLGMHAIWQAYWPSWSPLASQCFRGSRTRTMLLTV